MLKPKAGILLISAPECNDSIFFKSVILITHHNEQESIGLILNQPTKIYLSHIFKNISLDFKIYLGGPVDRQSLYFLHNQGDLIPNSIKITKNIYFGGEFNTVIRLINNKKLNNHNIKFFLGYSGWGIKQLDVEIDNKSWILEGNYDDRICFKKSTSKIWGDLIKLQESKIAMWTNMPKDPSLN